MTPPRKSRIVCECLGVTEDEVLSALGSEPRCSLRDLTALTSAGDGCTACHPLLKAYLERRDRAALAAS